jgi:hypothetical protein
MEQTATLPEYTEPTIQPTQAIKKGSKSRKLLMMFSLFIILVAGLAVLAIFLGSSNKKESDDAKTVVSNTNNNNQPTREDETESDDDQNTENENSDVVLEVTAPKANAVVGGEISLEGTVSKEVTELNIEILDIDDNLLGKGTIAISPTGLQNEVPWSGTVYIDTAPETQLGRILVKAFDSDTSTSQPVIFKKYSNPERVELVSPIENQLIKDKTITLKGRGMNFFEANVSYRVKDEFQNTLVESFFTLPGDNYGNWVDFDLEIPLDNLTQNSGKFGTLQIYEVSMENGEEKILLEIPVRFVE